MSVCYICKDTHVRRHIWVYILRIICLRNSVPPCETIFRLFFDGFPDDRHAVISNDHNFMNNIVPCL